MVVLDSVPLDASCKFHTDVVRSPGKMCLAVTELDPFDVVPLNAANVTPVTGPTTMPRANRLAPAASSLAPDRTGPAPLRPPDPHQLVDAQEQHGEDHQGQPAVSAGSPHQGEAEPPDVVKHQADGAAHRDGPPLDGVVRVALGGEVHVAGGHVDGPDPVGDQDVLVAGLPERHDVPDPGVERAG